VIATGFTAQQLSAGNGRTGTPDPLIEALLAEPGNTPLAAVQTQRSVRRTAADPHSRGFVVLSEPDPGTPLPLEIRVALLSVGQQASFTATGPWQLRNSTGQVLQQGRAGEPVSTALVGASGDGWLITGPLHAVVVNGRSYAGRLRLLPTSGGVSVINHLDLETYIAAVVGSEMPSSWPLEALMAQAVAARSYALAHMARPAARHWHLGDTTRWQAYTGLRAANSRTLQAAQRTAGLILSYQGAIVESLYAANRQISLEAHGHLGASMSQHGARQLAEAGHRYNAILGRYYPGASLARLRSGGG
jgi:peptidoglycan hydrolase-like amidase